MRFTNVSISSVAHLDAPHVITSDELEHQLAPTLDRLGVRRGLLRELSGIEARRFWDDGVMPSEVAAQVGEAAIAAAGIDRNRLGILINTSVSRDYVEPSTACIVHGTLGLSPSCMNFDLGNACLGFINGMEMVANMIERGQIEYGLVVNGESSRFVTEKTVERLLDPATDERTFRANFATLTLGSGAAAMVLGPAFGDGRRRFMGGVSLAATQHNRLCFGQVDRMETDTRALMEAGIDLAARTWADAVEELDWNADELDWLVLHQVSRAHTEAVAAALHLDGDKIYRLYPQYGNIGPAGVPIVLSKLEQEGHLAAGQRIALMGIGSGLNCAMAEVRW